MITTSPRKLSILTVKKKKKIGRKNPLLHELYTIYSRIYAVLSSQPRKNVRQCTSIKDTRFYAWAHKTTKRHLKHRFIPQLRDILPHLKRTLSVVSFRQTRPPSCPCRLPARTFFPGKGKRAYTAFGKNLREKLDANIS